MPSTYPHLFLILCNTNNNWLKQTNKQITDKSMYFVFSNPFYFHENVYQFIEKCHQIQKTVKSIFTGNSITKSLGTITELLI